MRKMSALICTLLALAMAVGLFMLRMPIAYAETFSQMKDSIPETVTFTIDGEKVKVPVILPDVETLPIGYICPLKVDKEKMSDLFGNMIKQPVENGRLTLESGVARWWIFHRVGEKFLEIIEKSGLPLEYRVEKILARDGRYENKEIEVSLVGKEEEVKLTNREYYYPSFTIKVQDRSRPIAGMRS